MDIGQAMADALAMYMRNQVGNNPVQTLPYRVPVGGPNLQFPVGQPIGGDPVQFAQPPVARMPGGQTLPNRAVDESEYLQKPAYRNLGNAFQR